MIQVKHISKTFNKGTVNEVRALQEINLEIPDGQFVVMIGTNGSGKSTFLNVVSGTETIDNGQILFEGKDVSKLQEYQRSHWIARVFQNPLSGTAPDLSILDNFRLAALRTHKKGLTIGTNSAFKRLAAEKISRLNMGLENKLDQPMGTLSGGQRQALTLIMGIMDTTKILLLDEPTAALDPRSAETVIKTALSIIEEYKLTAILITHNLKYAWHYGDRLIQMQEGNICRDLNATQKQQLQLNTLYEWF